MRMSVHDNLAEYNSRWMEQNEIYHKAAKRFGLSDSVFWIMYFLQEAGGTLGQREICAAMCVPKQTTNSALKKLESDGLISMSESASRRCKDVSLTDAGREMAERTAGRIIAAECRTMGELSAEEQEEFLRILNKYNKILSKRIGEIK